MEEVTYKNISAEEFSGLDYAGVTLVDLREPDELIVSGIAGAVNLPFSSFPKGIDDIPKDKPVCVFCREGSFSEEVAEILAIMHFFFLYVSLSTIIICLTMTIWA